MGRCEVHSPGLIRTVIQDCTQIPVPSLEHYLDQLDKLKTQFGAVPARKIASALTRLRRKNIDDPYSLIRLHELVLFLRAYPHNRAILEQAEVMLRAFPSRISRLKNTVVDLSTLEHPDVSGIAGMSVTDTFTYQIVNWLNRRNPSQLDFYWDWFEDENRLAQTWPRFMPLLEEDTFVEANIPYRDWLRQARGLQSEVSWLLNQFNKLDLHESEKSELYNSQKLFVRWQYSYRDSRTGLRQPCRQIFFHDQPLVQRSDINLKAELKSPTQKLKRLSTAAGLRAIDLACTASTVRYRELYGFTNGDPMSVYSTMLGRGVELVIITLPPEKRLPLRAYHSAMIYKNGVPIGYFESLSLFERMESGFNLYYTFREGETAWLYAKVLNVMRQLTGARTFSLDPYQIGFENEEGIESGAFWFYRKLGFRSTRRAIQRLTLEEEAKIAKRQNYRTRPATLRRLAKAPMVLELDDTRKGDWDRFQLRNIGFAVQRVMAQKFGGDVNRMKSAVVTSLENYLGVSSKAKGKAFIDFAFVLSAVPTLNHWTAEDKALLRQIIVAKETTNEGRYLALMQKHERLRKAIIDLGS